jgi:putative ABC transport system substrate-binding protein
MRRRKFVSLLGSASAVRPLVANGQQTRLLRIGIVSPGPPRTGPPFEWIEGRLHELGYLDGKNLFVDFVNLANRMDDYPKAMTDLVARKADVLLALGPELAIKAAAAATTTTPIVMLAIDYDPLALGYVHSLARPGGNITGIFLQQIELAEKRTELVKQIFPDLKAATVFWDGPSAPQWLAIQKLAPSLGLDIAGVELAEPPYDYEHALASVQADHRQFLIVANSPVFFFDRHRLSAFTIDRRLPAIFAWREWVDSGGLISYGPSFAGVSRRTADYIDRIARGAKAGDLPVEQPTKFELVVNLKSAKVLGLTLPQTLLARADDVIE